MTALVAEPAEVAAIAASIANAPLATFDLEFLAQDRLVPTLCLLQVSWVKLPTLDVPPALIVASPPEVRLIDPLAVDVRPVIEALAAHPCTVVHAARQDLGIVAAQFKIAMPAIADTQVMAAFAGLGDQVGLAALASELLGLSLAKDVQWTDWARRPLSGAQLAYADADVRHLPAMYAKLAHALGPRLAWARAESSAVAAEALAAANVTPETAWRQMNGLSKLDALAFVTACALAAWRFRVASELDKPIGWVVNDKQLIELARARPDAEGVRGTKGLSQIARQRATELAQVIAGVQPTDGAPPKLPAGIEATAAIRGPSVRAQRWSEMLLAIAQLAAEQTGVAQRLLATRADAEKFAKVVDEDGLDAAAQLPALSTWRRDVVGKLWRGWLEGTLVLAGNPAAATGVELLPR